MSRLNVNIQCIIEARLTNVPRKEDKYVLKAKYKVYHGKHCNVTFKTCFSDVFLPTQTQGSALYYRCLNFSRYQLSFPPRVFLIQVLVLSQQTSEITWFCVGAAKLYQYRQLCVSMASGQNAHTGYEVNMETEKLIHRWPVK